MTNWRTATNDSQYNYPIEPILRELGCDDVPTGSGWVRIKCPFHDDHTASASVNHDLNAFRCHTCDVSGDAIKLLKERLGMTFCQAKARAELLTGVKTNGKGKPKHKRRASDLLLGSDVA